AAAATAFVLCLRASHFQFVVSFLRCHRLKQQQQQQHQRQRQQHSQQEHISNK
ncbi:unnamed protein product, partial [Ceratitis capitata]